MSTYGMKSHVLMTFQDSFGTSDTSSQYALPIVNESLTHTIEQIAEQGMYNRYAESPYHEGLHQIAGDITMEAHPFYVGLLLTSAVGWTSSTSDTNDITHVFKPRTADWDNRIATNPVTMEVYRSVGSAHLFYDLGGDSLSFSISNGELLNVSASFIGAGFSRKGAGSPTYQTTPKPFIWDQFSGSFNSASICDIMDLTITFNNQLEASHVLCGSKTPYRIKRTGFQQIEVSGTVLFESHSYEQAFEAQTEYPFVVNFAGQQSPNSLKFDFPALRFKTFEPTIAGTGLIEASFTAQALFDVSSNTAMEVTLVNTYLPAQYEGSL